MTDIPKKSDGAEEAAGINVDLTRGEDCRRTVSIEVPPARLEREKKKVLREIAREVSIPGFRKGKAPEDIVSKRYAGEIHSEAIKSLLPDAWAEALSMKELSPIGDPVFREVEAGEGKPVSFCVDFEVEPEIELSSYKGIDVPAGEVSVEDEDVEKVLENLREREAEFEPVDRESSPGDVVVLDYLPVDEDGEPDESKKVTDYPVQLGSGQLFESFEREVAGKGPGETGRTSIEYPEDYSPEHLAGKRVEYIFTVKEVRERKVPALDDAFAGKVEERFDSLEDLREDIRSRLLEEKRGEAERRREEEAIDRIIDKNPFEVPRSMIERYRAELMKEDERRRSMAGVGPEEDEEKKRQMDEFFEKVSRRAIKRFFVIDRISSAEDLRVGDDELKKEMERLAEGSGRPFEEVEKYFAQGSDQRRNLRNRLRERKVFDLVLGRGGEGE